MRTPFVLAAFLLGLASSSSAQGLVPDPPKVCDSCDEWNKPKAPKKVFGTTYLVGTEGLSSILITSPDGHILLDGALPQSAALIDQNIRALGFKTEDVKWILTSHGHYDHVGGVSALQRLSGARVAASASTARALAAGTAVEDDPQIGFGRAENAFPVVKNVQVVSDGEVIRVGTLAVTAVMTPGHTPGATTWTWQACEGNTCKHIVYVDSMSAVAAPGFRFSADPARVEGFRRGIERVGALPCDALFALHPSSGEGHTCRTFADAALKRLDARLAEERKTP